MKRLVSILLTGVLLACLLAGCGGSGGAASHDNSYAAAEETIEEAYDSGFADSSTADSAPAGDSGSGTDLSGLKLVYTGSVTVQSTEYDATVADIKSLIAEFGCIVETANEFDYDMGWRDAAYKASARDYTWTLRVPSEKFSAMMDKLGTVHGHIESREQSAEDMTKQFRDNEGRISALKAQEQRLLSFMENAETISDTLEIEDRLTEVRYELEQLQNANNDIDFMAKYSKLTVRVHEVVDYDTTGMSFPQRVNQAFSDSSHGFVRVVQGLVIALIWLLPYLAIAAVVALILFLTRDKRAAKRAVRQEKRREKKSERFNRKMERKQARWDRKRRKQELKNPPQQDQPEETPEEDREEKLE